MSEDTYYKSKSLLKNRRVTLTENGDDFLYFKVDKYDVRVAKNSSCKDNCTCFSGSIWGVGRQCSHLEAAKRWMKGEDL